MAQSTTVVAIGVKVRELRLARGWSQQRLADRAEVSSSVVQQIEAGKANPRLRTLERLAVAFGLEDARELMVA